MQEERPRIFEYQISAKDFAKLMDIEPEAVYQEADKITDELMKSFIRLEMPDQKYKKRKIMRNIRYFQSVATLMGY